MRYVAFLRAISHVPMAPYRAKLEALGHKDVVSYGGTGNLLFTGAGADRATHEARIAKAVGTEAFVRSRPQIARTVRSHPYEGEPNAAVLFLARAPSKAARDALAAMELVGPPPVVRGDEVAFVWPPREKGKRSPLSLERALGQPGTMRTWRVVAAVDEKLRG